ncbi:MAG: SCP2 sterol-binding domain-containing protein [Anaerolineae bacterium]
MTTVADLFNGMRDRFQADKAKGDKATLAFELAGEGGGTYWLHVNDGQLEIGQGAPPSEADAIVRADGGDFVQIMTGQLNPMMAFMSGKVKVERNMGMVMKLMGWFGM